MAGGTTGPPVSPATGPQRAFPEHLQMHAGNPLSLRVGAQTSGPDKSWGGGARRFALRMAHRPLPGSCLMESARVARLWGQHRPSEPRGTQPGSESQNAPPRVEAEVFLELWASPPVTPARSPCGQSACPRGAPQIVSQWERTPAVPIQLRNLEEERRESRGDSG